MFHEILKWFNKELSDLFGSYFQTVEDRFAAFEARVAHLESEVGVEASKVEELIATSIGHKPETNDDATTLHPPESTEGPEVAATPVSTGQKNTTVQTQGPTGGNEVQAASGSPGGFPPPNPAPAPVPAPVGTGGNPAGSATPTLLPVGGTTPTPAPVGGGPVGESAVADKATIDVTKLPT